MGCNSDVGVLKSDATSSRLIDGHVSGRIGGPPMQFLVKDFIFVRGTCLVLKRESSWVRGSNDQYCMPSNGIFLLYLARRSNHRARAHLYNTVRASSISGRVGPSFGNRPGAGARRSTTLNAHNNWLSSGPLLESTIHALRTLSASNPPVPML
jgi:hypothetical protein